MKELCQVVGVSRANYYRFRRRVQAQARDMDLRSQIQPIALYWPAYGYRRVHAELVRQGWKVNHKRVLRLMRADNLLCLRRRKFLLSTTDSQHNLPIYPNLAKHVRPTGIDQLWIADITYIRLQIEFVYLAVLLDAFSRRCIGWALQRTLEATLTLEALRMALRQRRPRPGLVHHSDRGVQYAMDVGFAVICPLARRRRPHHPVFVHRLAPLLHASFRPRLATMVGSRTGAILLGVAYPFLSVSSESASLSNP